MGVNEHVTWSAYRCSSQRKYTSYYTSTCKVGEVTKACVLVEHVRKPMEFKLLQWNAYIQQTETDDNVKLMQLQAACDDQLRLRVFESGVYSTLTTPDLFLQKMKELAVITVHTAVHLRNLWKMQQSTDENIRAFAARVTATADMCNMKVKCICDNSVSYRD